jgi:hypothetical protein
VTEQEYGQMRFERHLPVHERLVLSNPEELDAGVARLHHNRAAIRCKFERGALGGAPPPFAPVAIEDQDMPRRFITLFDRRDYRSVIGQARLREGAWAHGNCLLGQEVDDVDGAVTNHGSPRSVWIGLNDVANEGQFVFTNGTPVNYTRWGAGQPDNGSGVENYVALYVGNGPWGNTNWIDVQDQASPGIGNIYGVVEVATCPCDWNQSGGVNSQDFFDFLTTFFAGNADLNASGSTNSQDFFDFLACFFSGCP